MSKPLVVGYYTIDTPYEHEKETLKLSLETHGYSFEFLGIPNLGSWQKNTQFKSHFIKDMMTKYPATPLLYLDVDAIMLKPPEILDDINCDIAAVHYARNQELLSGTVYFSGSAACMKVVDRWIALNHQYPETLPDGRDAWDQRTLSMAIKDIRECKFQELPQEYTWIVELTDKWSPGLIPVIMHTRGAKRFKHIMDGKEGYAK